MTHYRGVQRYHRKAVETTTKPEVGMGATYCCGSDCYPFTIIEVSKSRNQIRVQEDESIRLDKNGISERQEYSYQPNLKGRILTIKLRKNGRWVEVGQGLWSFGFHIGSRNRYYDPSF